VDHTTRFKKRNGVVSSGRDLSVRYCQDKGPSTVLTGLLERENSAATGEQKFAVTGGALACHMAYAGMGLEGVVGT
jgi:hypothetical protein